MGAYVVVETCKYEGIQTLYRKLFTDRPTAEEFANQQLRDHISQRIDGYKASIAYQTELLSDAADSVERQARQKSIERDRAELARWESGERGMHESWAVVELEEAG